MLALYLLREKDKYGYQLTQEINQRSAGKFPVTEGALYIVLYRLIDKGYISKKEEAGVKRARVFYHLEPDGEIFLDDLVNAYLSIHEGISSVLQGKGEGNE